jgi:hypothetical protein
VQGLAQAEALVRAQVLERARAQVLERAQVRAQVLERGPEQGPSQVRMLVLVLGSSRQAPRTSHGGAPRRTATRRVPRPA